jgi:hypothetical protein
MEKFVIFFIIQDLGVIYIYYHIFNIFHLSNIYLLFIYFDQLIH